MGDLGHQIQAAVGEAIERVISEQESGFVTKWVAIVESAGPDGTRGIWTLTNDDIKAWDALGLLAYGTQLQQARAVVNEIADE